VNDTAWGCKVGIIADVALRVGSDRYLSWCCAPASKILCLVHEDAPPFFSAMRRCLDAAPILFYH